MAHLEYGFDPNFSNIDADPWINLKTIDEYLRDSEAIPPDLATWLGHAIRFSKGDPNEFMRRLGLKKPRGRRTYKHALDAWLQWGKRVHLLEANGESPETALNTAAREYSETHSEGVDRTTLQGWRDTYRKGLAAK